MKIWCIDYGEFGVALIEGIDRAKKSQVTAFVDRHGDHSIQHVAFDTHDLDKFIEHMTLDGRHTARRGAGAQRRLRRPQADVRPRLRARVRPTTTSLPRVRRSARTPGEQPTTSSITFAEETGKGFYDQVADAVDSGDDAPFFDFSKMPADWEVPEAQPLEGAR